MLQQNFGRQEFETDPFFDNIKNFPQIGQYYGSQPQNYCIPNPNIQGDQYFAQYNLLQEQQYAKQLDHTSQLLNLESIQAQQANNKSNLNTNTQLEQQTMQDNQTLECLDLLVDDNIDCQDGNSQYNRLSNSQNRASGCTAITLFKAVSRGSIKKDKAAYRLELQRQFKTKSMHNKQVGSPYAEGVDSQPHKSSSSVFAKPIDSQVPNKHITQGHGSMQYINGEYNNGNSSQYFEDDQQKTKDRRERRMLSNRESARRSRKRKQEQLQGLMGELQQQATSKQNMTTNLDKLQRENDALSLENKRLKEEVQSVKADYRSLVNQMLGSRIQAQNENQVQPQQASKQKPNSDNSSQEFINSSEFHNPNKGSVNLNLYP